MASMMAKISAIFFATVALLVIQNLVEQRRAKLKTVLFRNTANTELRSSLDARSSRFMHKDARSTLQASKSQAQSKTPVDLRLSAKFLPGTPVMALWNADGEIDAK